MVVNIWYMSIVLFYFIFKEMCVEMISKYTHICNNVLRSKLFDSHLNVSKICIGSGYILHSVLIQFDK